jgi:hypothetical protein
MRPGSLIAVALAAATLAACGSSSSSSTPRAADGRSPAHSSVRDVRDVNQLRTLFNAQSEKPRLIVLASPT